MSSVAIKATWFHNAAKIRQTYTAQQLGKDVLNSELEVASYIFFRKIEIYYSNPEKMSTNINRGGTLIYTKSIYNSPESSLNIIIAVQQN